MRDLNGAHPDADRLWKEEGYQEGGPWNYIEFHELNGGNEDDLMTDDSRDRMRFYQPGVAGTPELEADGGYVQLGGSHGSTASANYEDMKQALRDSGERDAIKMVNLQVGTIYDGTIYSIKVTVDYISNEETFFPTPEKPFPDDTLNGLLYVFMLEDNVTAYSKTLDEDVTCHNVFREYAIQDRAFQMQPGDSQEFYAEWTVPDTMVRDGEEIPILVPINPNNVFPVAVVYDDDDRSSGRNDGSENNNGDGGGGSPRALNSATPAQTAYDLGNRSPIIEVYEPTSSGGRIQVNAQIWDDGDELAAAFVIYREVGDDHGQWKFKPLTIGGEECSGSTCSVGTGEAHAVLPVSTDKQVEYSIAAYDVDWTRGITGIHIASVDDDDDDSMVTIMMAGGFLILLAAAGAALYIRQAHQTPEEFDDPDLAGGMEETGDRMEEPDYVHAGPDGRPDDGPDDGPDDETAASDTGYTWNEFRTLHKGRPKDEISRLWKEYKETEQGEE